MQDIPDRVAQNKMYIKAQGRSENMHSLLDLGKEHTFTN